MKKKVTILLAALLLIAAGLAWVLMSYHVIDFQFYPKKAEMLDLRGKEITLEHYESLAQRMPECEILWDVPFQGGSYSSDSRSLTAGSLTEDMALLSYFPKLEMLDARSCTDLSQLSALQEAYPELEVLVTVPLDGSTYSQDAQTITLSSITQKELELLPYLTELDLVTVTEGGDTSCLQELKDYCQEKNIEFRIVLNGQTLPEEEKTLTIANVTDNQAELLMLMPGLESVHLPEPEAKAETLLALTRKLPETQVTWEKTVMGITFAQDAKQIDLTDVIARAEGESPDAKTAWEYGLEYPVMGTREQEPRTAKVLKAHPFPDKADMTGQLIAEAEAAMAYFPEAEKLLMCGAWLDNEAMSQFREDHRADYKVVWTVQCGDVAPRTDATFFMPTKYGVSSGGFNELYSENLRYCEDIVSMDIGHMQVVSIEFLRYMPNLKYLVLFSQPVYDLSPLSECKNLVFLELSMCSWISDYSPLLGCTALEDLNIENSSGNITPLLEMTWLKNLWLGDCGAGTYQIAKAALPTTNIGYSGNSSFKWRSLSNYYKMRDALLMFYMS